MGEKQPVTQGEAITVTVQDVEDSDWGSLLARRQKLFPTERRDIILTTWIRQAKKDLILRTGRVWSYFTGDDDFNEDATQIIVMLVGIRILRRAQAARVDVTETSYQTQIDDLEIEIDTKILNHEDPESPISVGNVEPDMVDPDEDYDYDT